MSVFRVKLQNLVQGRLDMDPTSYVAGAGYGQLGTPFTASKQRQVYIMGPGKINRLLKDGDTFTDCNYYKQFCYPYCTLDKAILEIVSDDGSNWSPIAGENLTPVVINVTVDEGDDFADTAIDIVSTYGGPAVMTQIENRDDATAVSVRLNGQDAAVFTLDAGDQQIFNSGDLLVNELAFAQSTSGGGSVDIQIILSVSSACNS